MTRLVTMRELAAALHPKRSRWRSFAMLKAYFDDSGAYADNPVSALAGYIGTEAQWSEIESKWKEVLREFEGKGVATFHMCDALAQEGEFSRLEKPFVNRILMELGRILESALITPLFSAVINDDWDEMVKDDDFLARFPKPLDLCFDDIVRQICEWSHRVAHSELVVPMFGYSDEYHLRFQTIYSSYGAEPWYRSVLGPLAFDYPCRVIPLQCADYAANRTRDEIEARRYAPMRGSTLAYKMAAPGHHRGHWFRADTLHLTVQRWKETGEIYPIARP